MSPVDPLNTSLYFTAAAQAARQKQQANEKKAEKPLRKTFNQLLSAAEETEKVSVEGLPQEIANLSRDQALQVLLDDVYASGDALKKDFGAGAIVRYKTAVKHFMDFVVQNSYDIDLRESSKLVKKRKKFYRLQIIDEKLDQLASGVLYNNRDQLQLLAKIDEINGLLVDLLS